MKLTSYGSQTVPTVEKDGEIYPSDVTKNGWLFDPDSGEQIVGKYLFGETDNVTDKDLRFTIDDLSSQTTVKIPTDNSLYILIGIGIASAIAILWYLKNIRTKN
jgi:hypothetical protein